MIQIMFLEMQNSFLSGIFAFKANTILLHLFNQLFADFEYHTRVADQICAYLRKISGLVSLC